MTLIIALKCRDGLIMAADSMSTEMAPKPGPAITKHEAEKIVFQKELMWGATGAVGIKQLVSETIELNYNKIYQPTDSPVRLRQKLMRHLQPVIKDQYDMVAAMSGGDRNAIPWTDFLFGAHLASGFCLINIERDMNGEVIDCPHFAIGSAMKTGQALLRRLRNQDWDLRMGAAVAYRTMNDAIHVEPAGIGPPIRVAKYYLDGNKRRCDMIEGEELSQIRDAAMAWTKTEQEVLEGLLRPDQAVTETTPIPG